MLALVQHLDLNPLIRTMIEKADTLQGRVVSGGQSLSFSANHDVIRNASLARAIKKIADFPLQRGNDMVLHPSDPQPQRLADLMTDIDGQSERSRQSVALIYVSYAMAVMAERRLSSQHEIAAQQFNESIPAALSRFKKNHQDESAFWAYTQSQLNQLIGSHYQAIIQARKNHLAPELYDLFFENTATALGEVGHTLQAMRDDPNLTAKHLSVEQKMRYFFKAYDIPIAGDFTFDGQTAIYYREIDKYLMTSGLPSSELERIRLQYFGVPSLDRSNSIDARSKVANPFATR
jgi:hypothetical protein